MDKPIRPRYPIESMYEAGLKRCYIYKYFQTFREEDEDVVNGKDISEITLSWLIEQLPENLKHKDIKIEFGYNSSAFAIEDHYVNFYYEIDTPDRMEDFKLAMANYQLDLKQYEKDQLIYEKYLNEQEIKKTEEKLATLKKQR